MGKDITYWILNGIFGDKRLDIRASNLVEKMVSRETVVINRCYDDNTSRIGAYRMINSNSWEIDDVILGLQSAFSRNLEGEKAGHVLLVEDTSDFDFSQLSGRLDLDDPDLGPTFHSSSLGFLLHPTLAIDACSGIPLGFPFVRAWNRDKDAVKKREREYQKKPIKDKESYRWIESAVESGKLIPAGIKKTVIADRESDVYDVIVGIQETGSDLLIRSSANRRLSDEEMTLQEKMKSLPGMHVYKLQVKGNHSRKNREAVMELRYGEVTLERPHSASADSPGCITVNCVHVIERGESTPVNESPIEWRLLTTHPVSSVEQAMQVVEWYKQRWYIEEVFRLLKTRGMQVESVQMERGVALKKITMLALVAALKIMTLKLSFDRELEEKEACITFSRGETRVLEILQRKMEGKTIKQKNPFKHLSLPWAAWIIARLGGWNGYSSTSRPGYITFSQGFQRFQSYFDFFQFVKEDVYRE